MTSIFCFIIGQQHGPSQFYTVVCRLRPFGFSEAGLIIAVSFNSSLKSQNNCKSENIFEMNLHLQCSEAMFLY